MKFAAVVLLACVAVSSAAFTGSLVQHSRPAVDQAMFQLRLATTTKTAALPQIGQIIDHIQASINQILANIDNVITNFNTHIKPILQNAYLAIQQNAGNVVQIIQQTIQDIQAALGINTRGLGDNIQAAIQFIQGLPQFIANLQAHISNQISSIDFDLLFHNAVQAVLPENIAQLVFSMIGHNHANRGIIGDLWDSIWGQITGTISDISTQIATIFDSLLTIGQDAVGAIQATASQYLQDFTNGVSTVSSNVAAALLLKIREMKDQLGAIYDDVVASLQQQCFSGAHSANPNCQVGGGDARIRAF